MSELSKYILSVRHGTLMENRVIPNIWLHLEMPLQRFDLYAEIWITLYSRVKSWIKIRCGTWFTMLHSLCIDSYGGQICNICSNGMHSSMTFKIGSWSAPRSHETVLIGSMASVKARKNGRIFIIFIISLFYSLDFSTLSFSVKVPKVSPAVLLLTFRLL